MKILLLGAELFHADGQTDIRDETNSRFFFAVLQTGLKDVLCAGRVALPALSVNTERDKFRKSNSRYPTQR